MIPIFPGKCTGCGRLMERGFLCDACADALRRATLEICVDCNKPFRECRCVPSRIEGRRVVGFAKLYNYDPSDSAAPTSHMIYVFKRGRSRKVIGIFADHIAPLLSASGITGEKWKVAYVPRSRKAIGKYGYDHMKKLAEEVARRLGCERIVALRHRGNREQKRLGAVGRAYAAANSYQINPRADLKGARILLLDDVLTTGATLQNCTTALFRAGASKIFCAVIAETRRSRVPTEQ